MNARRSKAVITISAAVALVAAIGAAAFWPSHAYRARSGYSGHHFWIAFRTYPTEKQLYDAVVGREPSLSLGNDRLDEVQAARRGFVPEFPAGDLVMAPYEPGQSPDTVFPDGRVKGVWLTEPSARTEFPPAVVRAAYFICVLAVVFIATLLILSLLRWGRYFFLGRVTEVSSAVRRPPNET
jgi:hypothetical protein